MLKICTRCKEEKLLNDFFFKNKAIGKKQSQCKDCCGMQRRSKEHYIQYKSEYIKRALVRNTRIRIEHHIKLGEFFKDHPCVDCGEKDILVLEFDHKNPLLKIGNVGALMNNAIKWETIEKEIKKCDVRCANCHKRKTAKQCNSWRLRV